VCLSFLLLLTMTSTPSRICHSSSTTCIRYEMKYECVNQPSCTCILSCLYSCGSRRSFLCHELHSLGFFTRKNLRDRACMGLVKPRGQHQSKPLLLSIWPLWSTSIKAMPVV
jgi:hypothetical protein